MTIDDAPDDAALTQAFRAGSADAAGRIFDRHAPLVRRLFARSLGPFHEVEDHVQDTFLAFFRQVDELRSDEKSRAFLVSIAIRQARKELRRRKVRRILRLSPPEELVEAAGSSTTDYEGREAVRRLFAILDDLDASSRIAYTLRHLEEMELTEVAAALDESLATVKRRLAKVEPIVQARLGERN